MKKRSRGKWGQSGLSAITIAGLMNCHVYTAKRYLYKLRNNLQLDSRDIPDSEIGRLVHLYIESKNLQGLMKELSQLS